MATKKSTPKAAPKAAAKAPKEAAPAKASKKRASKFDGGLPEAQLTRYNELVAELKTAADSINTLQSDLKAKRAQIEKLVTSFNETLTNLQAACEQYDNAVEEANEFVDDIQEKLEEYMDDQSEEWQESDEATQYHNWIEAWDIFLEGTEDSEVAAIEEMEVPEEDELEVEVDYSDFANLPLKREDV